MLVYVINKHGKPLMPCSPRKARKLLEAGKVKVIRREPFTIKLLYGSSGYKQPLTLGVDTGSSTIGSAVVEEEKGDVLYVSEVTIRNDITRTMKQRSGARRNRRNRKTRYRKARFLNRRNSIKKDRFSPTMTSKINSHLKEIKFVKSILPIKNIVIETATFDPHLLKNPKLYNENYKKWGYQKGLNYGFWNTKAFVLDRDNYTCQNCKGKSKDSKLEAHHIIFRSNNGSDEAENLITLCKTCHDKVHDGSLKLKRTGKIKSQLKHATQMNSIRVQILKRLPEALETFGYITKLNRIYLELPKKHYIDAVVIASQGNPITFRTNNIILKRCVSKGDYQQSKGVRSEKRIPTGKIHGFRKFDKVRYLGEIYFIKGRMSSGHAILMGIDNQKIDFSDAPRGMKTPKMCNLEKISSRKSCIIDQKIIANFC